MAGSGRLPPPRLRRLIPYIAAGRSNRWIANRLSLSPHTVENYISDLMAPWRTDGRGALVVSALTLIANNPLETEEVTP